VRPPRFFNWDKPFQPNQTSSMPITTWGSSTSIGRSQNKPKGAEREFLQGLQEVLRHRDLSLHYQYGQGLQEGPGTI
jgi:hypothetical protein